MQKYRKLQIPQLYQSKALSAQTAFFFFALWSSDFVFFLFFLQKINLLNLGVDGICNPPEKQPRHTVFLFSSLLCSRGALSPSLGTLLCSSLAPLPHDHLNSRKVVTYSINTVMIEKKKLKKMVL